MKENNSIASKQPQSRSFSELVVVYKKLLRFYFYNFFSQKYSLWLVISYLASLAVPLIFNIFVRGDLRSRIWNSALENENGIFIVLLLSVFGTAPGIFALLYNFLLTFVIASSINQSLLHFLRRRVDEKTSLQEISIISSVKNIKPYDIFVIEAIITFLLHSFYFIVVLAIAFLTGRNFRMVFPWIALISFVGNYLYYVLGSSPKNVLAFLTFLTWRYFEYDYFVYKTTTLPFRSIIRVTALFVVSLRACYDNSLKMKQLHG